MVEFRSKGRGRRRRVYPLTQSSSKRGNFRVKATTDEKWFQAEKTLSGWSKSQKVKERHKCIRKAIKSKGLLRTFNSLLGLANVTTDKETERKARADYRWMSKEYTKGLHLARARAR